MRIAATLIAVSAVLGCETFDPPPDVQIANSDNGVMTAPPEEPLVLEFSEPFVRSSLRMKVVAATVDPEGNLLDEQSPPKLDEFSASTLLAYDGKRPDDPASTFGATFDVTNDRLVATRAEPFGWSAPFLVLIEPGLKDAEGNVTVPRRRLPFTYILPGGGPTTLPTGYYYFLMNVDYLSTQIQVYAYLEVDPETGIWRAIFTNANRRPELNSRAGCPASCPDDTPICALHPSAGCVKPSLKQLEVEHYTDFLPEWDPPDGYTFIADGFARDEPDGSIAMGTAPFLIDLNIGSGGVNVRAEGTKVTGTFRPDANQPERWVAEGSISVDVVKINGAGLDPTKGTFKAMTLTADEVAAVEAFGFPIPTDLGLP